MPSRRLCTSRFTSTISTDCSSTSRLLGGIGRVPQLIPVGPQAGTNVFYAVGLDGSAIEFMQPES
jgi:hypothetical protein